MKKINVNQQLPEISDIDMLTHIFNKYYPVVYVHINKMMRSHPDPAVDADDIASETFIRAFEKREKIQNPEKLLRWLLKTARNLMIDKIRTSEKQTRYLPISSLDGLSTDESNASFASMLAERSTKQTEANRHSLGQLLYLLSDKDREIIELKLDGLTPKDIAKAIDSTPEAVQKRWERLITWLRPIALHLDELQNCLIKENDRKIMERYLDGQSLLDIAEAVATPYATVERTVKRVIAQWKKAAKRNPTDPVSAMVDNGKKI